MNTLDDDIDSRKMTATVHCVSIEGQSDTIEVHVPRKTLLEIVKVSCKFKNASFICIINHLISFQNLRINENPDLENKIRLECNHTVVNYSKCRSEREKERYLDDVYKIPIPSSDMLSQSEENSVKAPEIVISEPTTFYSSDPLVPNSGGEITHEALQRKIQFLEQRLETVQRVNKQMESTNKSLRDQLKSVSTPATQQFDLRRKNFPDTPLQKLKEIGHRSLLALNFLGNYGMIFNTLIVTDNAKKNHVISLTDKSYSAFAGEFCFLNQNDPLKDQSEKGKRCVLNMVKLMDRYGISLESYKAMRRVCAFLPSFKLINECKNELSFGTQAELLGEDYAGAQLNINSVLAFITKHKLSENGTLKLKLTGLGAQVRPSSHWSTISLNNIDNPCKNDIPVMLVEVPYSYDSISFSMGAYINALSNIVSTKSVTCDTSTYDADLILVGHLPLIYTMLGMEGETSDFPCPWCMIHKNEMAKATATFTQYNVTRKRTLAKIKKHATGNSGFGCINVPLLDVELEDVVIDLLHLYCQLSDTLLRNFIMECMEMEESDPNSILLSLPKTLCKPRKPFFHIWKNKDQDLQWTRMNALERERLTQSMLETVPTTELLHKNTQSDVLALWKGLLDLMYSLLDPEDKTREDLENEAKDWVNKFCSLSVHRTGYGAEFVTLQMHILMFHAPAQAIRHGGFRKIVGKAIKVFNHVRQKQFQEIKDPWKAAKSVLEISHRQINSDDIPLVEKELSIKVVKKKKKKKQQVTNQEERKSQKQQQQQPDQDSSKKKGDEKSATKKKKVKGKTKKVQPKQSALAEEQAIDSPDNDGIEIIAASTSETSQQAATSNSSWATYEDNSEEFISADIDVPVKVEQKSAENDANERARISLKRELLNYNEEEQEELIECNGMQLKRIKLEPFSEAPATGGGRNSEDDDVQVKEEAAILP